MKKLDIEFCISDDSVNVYGYRLLTSGFEKDKFNPPIGFLMHERDQGVAVRWEDIRTEVGKIFAKPVINDELFPALAQQIEDGFYNAASVGHIVALEVSDDDMFKLEGQTGPTVIRWFCRECSIVDIPGNYNAIAQLYDESGNVLHDLSANLNITNMANTTATVQVRDLGLPNLKDNATADEAIVAVKELRERAEKAERECKELADKAVSSEVDLILDTAVKERKITTALMQQLKADYHGNPDGLRKLTEQMPVMPLLTDQLSHDIPEHLKGKSFSDLYLSGELEKVKADYPAYYEQLKKTAANK